MILRNVSIFVGKENVVNRTNARAISKRRVPRRQLIRKLRHNGAGRCTLRAPSLRGTFCLRRGVVRQRSHSRINAGSSTQHTMCVNVRPDLSLSFFLFLSLSLSLSLILIGVTHGRHAVLDNKLERNGETPIPRVLAQGKRHGGN